jgi:hypothetical protein
VALKLFVVNSKRTEIRSAVTYYIASRASTQAGKPDQASKLMDKARECKDFPEHKHLQLRHLYELAEYFALERNSARALTLLMDANETKPSDIMSQMEYELASQRVALIAGVSGSFDELQRIRDDLILLGCQHKLSNKQLLLDASWFLLLASIRFKHHETFHEVVQDLRTSRLLASRDHKLVYHLKEPDKHRQYDARLLLRFGLIRRLVARHIIMRPVL